MAEFGSMVNLDRLGDAANGHPVSVVTYKGKETNPDDSAYALSLVGKIAKEAATRLCPRALSGECCAKVLTTSVDVLATVDTYSVNCSGTECPMDYPGVEAAELPESPFGLDD